MEAPKIKRIFSDTRDKIKPNLEQPASDKGQEDFYSPPLKNNVFTIQGVEIRDIDLAVKAHIEEMMGEIDSQGAVPLYAYSLQRFDETAQNYQDSMGDGTLKMPFAILDKISSPEKGSNMGGAAIPPTETSFKLSSIITNEKGIEKRVFFKVPQPIMIDIKYSLVVFSNNLDEINAIDTKLISEFSRYQSYVKVKDKHYMALTLSSVTQTDETSLENRRFYKHPYEIVLQGYIINQRKIIKINPASISLQIGTEDAFSDRQCSGVLCDNVISFKFSKKNKNSLQYIFEGDFNATSDNQGDTGNYSLFLNEKPISFPFSAQKGDVLTIEKSSAIKHGTTYKIYAQS
jgi:hypothetical protein